MKKLLIFAVFSLLSLAVNAQEKKSWDFSKGISNETLADMAADASNWTDKGDGRWANTEGAKALVNGQLTANGNVISEVSHLTFDNGKNTGKELFILGSGKFRISKAIKVTFPKLVNGQTIIVQGMSANATATDRGIKASYDYMKFQADASSPQTNGGCYFLGNQAAGSEGTYTFVWKIETEETDSVDVQFELINGGIDFTLFQIDEGDAPEKEDAPKTAYIYGGDESVLAEDMIYFYLEYNELVDVHPISINASLTAASLSSEYDAVVIAPSVTATEAAVLKNIIAFMPVVNLNADIYAALGYGKAVETATNILTIADAGNAIFEGLDTQIEYLDGNITGVELGDYFAKDAVLAKAGDVVGIHAHNASRNAYYYIPGTNYGDSEEILLTLIPQTVVAAAKTKRDITAAGTPVIAVEQQDGKSVVTITAANSKAIYYTTDGSEPTTGSTLYTAPFALTAKATVKAFATGDGYTDSQVATKEVEIATAAAAPEFTVAREDSKSIVTIESTTPGAKVYFNFNNAKTPALSQLYTEPVVLTEPVRIYAIAAAEGYLNSELSYEYIGINGVDATNIRIDTLAYFNPNATTWDIDTTTDGVGTGYNTSANYYWGKNAWKYYSEEVDHEETVKGSDGQDSTVYIYKPDPAALKVLKSPTDENWVLKSAGQVLTGELKLAPEKGVGNGAASRYADEAIDFIGEPTAGVITFGGKTSGEPYTGRIESTGKLAGPFDVVVYCGNGNNGAPGILEIQTSTDGEKWETVDTLKMSATQRYIKRTRASYEGTDNVYVRVAQTGGSTKAQVYNIIVLNHGKLSEGYDEETATIEKVEIEPAGDIVRSEVYTLNGTRTANVGPGIYIIRLTYANGVTVSKKVMLK